MEKIWLKSYRKDVPPEIKFDEITLSEALTKSASTFPDNPALLFQGTTVTFRELDNLVNRFASSLIALGLKPGDRVATLLPNLVQMVVAVYGAFRAGAIAVTNNPLYTDRELEHQFNDSGSTFLVSLDLFVPRMIDLRKKTGITSIVSCHIGDYLPSPMNNPEILAKMGMHLKTPPAKDVFEFTDLVKDSVSSLQFPKRPWDDTACLLYTGGTTGLSKGVQLTHKNLSCNVQQTIAWFPDFNLGAERVVGCLPFFHSFGMTSAMNTAIFYGYSNALVPKPEPKTILEAIEKFKVTFISAVPTMYNGMINYPELNKYDLSSLKGCFSGGAPLPMETIIKFKELTGIEICEGYGLTESSPTTHVNPYGAKTKPGSIGLPFCNTDAKIVDVNDYEKEVTSPGTPGELCVKGPQVMKGYINRPEETDMTLKDGWLLTGDIAVFDEEGYFSIVDRKKDMIISGGYNIYPRDVDEVLFSHPKVLEACAIGIPDAYSGERVKAFVVLKAGEHATESEIIEFCKQNLAKYKVPKYVEFIESLPKSAIGKILRKELRRLELENKQGDAKLEQVGN
ncbi:MAG: long-chain-fatty-acid--CoA ligase [Desulfomonilaceae bacterium]